MEESENFIDVMNPCHYGSIRPNDTEEPVTRAQRDVYTKKHLQHCLTNEKMFEHVTDFVYLISPKRNTFKFVVFPATTTRNDIIKKKVEADKSVFFLCKSSSAKINKLNLRLNDKYANFKTFVKTDAKLTGKKGQYVLAIVVSNKKIHDKVISKLIGICNYIKELWCDHYYTVYCDTGEIKINMLYVNRRYKAFLNSLNGRIVDTSDSTVPIEELRKRNKLFDTKMSMNYYIPPV